MATLVIRMSVGPLVDPLFADPLDIASDLMSLYDDHVKANADDELTQAELADSVLEAEWED